MQRINEVMIYAVNSGFIDANPASGLGMAFEKPKKAYAHTQTRRIDKVDAVFIYVEQSVSTRCLIEWQLLTLVRPSKASGAKMDRKQFWE